MLEVVEDFDGNAYRAVYPVKFEGTVYCLHAFQKKSRRRIETPKEEIETVRRRLKRAEEIHSERTKEEQKMKTKDYVVSSGNVFADLKVSSPEEALLKARLAVAVTKVIKARQLTQKEAGKLMGLKQPKVCDILAGRLTGYSVERLMRFLTLLGQDVEVTVRPHRTRGPAHLQFVMA